MRGVELTKRRGGQALCMSKRLDSLVSVFPVVPELSETAASNDRVVSQVLEVIATRYVPIVYVLKLVCIL